MVVQMHQIHNENSDNRITVNPNTVRVHKSTFFPLCLTFNENHNVTSGNNKTEIVTNKINDLVLITWVHCNVNFNCC